MKKHEIDICNQSSIFSQSLHFEISEIEIQQIEFFIDRYTLKFQKLKSNQKFMA